MPENGSLILLPLLARTHVRASEYCVLSRARSGPVPLCLRSSRVMNHPWEEFSGFTLMNGDKICNLCITFCFHDPNTVRYMQAENWNYIQIQLGQQVWWKHCCRVAFKTGFLWMVLHRTVQDKLQILELTRDFELLPPEPSFLLCAHAKAANSKGAPESKDDSVLFSSLWLG